MANVSHNVLRNLPKRQNQYDIVCGWGYCDRETDRNLGAPLCMYHAKKLVAQVMVLTGPVITGRPIRTKPRPTPQSSKGVVYFVLFGDRIKIGFTTSMETRMRVIPHDKILATMPGTISTERQMHKRFKEHRVNGEWFTPAPELMEFIGTLSQHTSIAS